MDTKGRPLAPEKPVGFNHIPLVIEASGQASVAPAAAEEPPAAPTPRPARRCSWRRTTDDGDMLELECARKRLGLTTCEKKRPAGRKGGLLGWLKGGKGRQVAQAAVQAAAAVPHAQL